MKKHSNLWPIQQISLPLDLWYSQCMQRWSRVTTILEWLKLGLIWSLQKWWAGCLYPPPLYVSLTFSLVISTQLICPISYVTLSVGLLVCPVVCHTVQFQTRILFNLLFCPCPLNPTDTVMYTTLFFSKCNTKLELYTYATCLHTCYS